MKQRYAKILQYDSTMPRRMKKATFPIRDFHIFVLDKRLSCIYLNANVERKEIVVNDLATAGTGILLLCELAQKFGQVRSFVQA